MNRRIALGIVTAIIVQVVLFVSLDYFLDSQSKYGSSFLFLALQSAIISLLGITVGAYVARTGFISAAIAIWFVEWLVIIYVLALIGDGQYTYLTVALMVAKLNWLAIVTSLLFTVVGVKLGQLARAKFSAVPTAI